MSLRRTLLLTSVALAAGAVAVALIVLSLGARETVVAQARADGELLARVLSSLGRLREQVGPDGLVDGLLATGQVQRVRVVGPDGDTVAEGGRTGPRELPWPPLDADAVRAGRVSSRIEGRVMHLLAPLVSASGQARGAIEVQVRLDGLGRQLDRQRWQALLAGTLALFLSALGAVAMAHRAGRPVERITEAVTQVQAGRFDPGSLAGLALRRDELGRLATGFIDMYRTLAEYHVNMEHRVVRRTEALSEVNARLCREADEREQAESALRHSEERFRDFAELSADWFWEMDAGLRFTYIAGNYYDSLQVPDDRVVGRGHREFFLSQSDDAAQWEPQLRAFCEHRARVNFEYRWLRADGTIRVIRTSAKAQQDDDGNFAGYRGNATDITETHTLFTQLSYQASHDALTGLVNRRELENRLGRVLDTAHADSSEHALCYLDMDQFKLVNDTCGHVAGDELLRQVGALLSGHIRKRDTLARLGGDEFVVLMEHCNLEQAERVADGMRTAVQAFHFRWKAEIFSVGVSIGLVQVDGSSDDITGVLRAADSACYAAKEEGRNRIHVYREDDATLSRRRGEMRWVGRITQALEEDRLELQRQTILPLGAGADPGAHFELLVRLRESDGTLVAPGDFLPAVERYNLAPRLDRWVVDAGLRWLTAEPSRVKRTGLCSINLSAQSLAEAGFLRFVTERVDRYPRLAERLCFEITETAAIANLPSAVRFIKALQVRGCRFALDDFGSGLSSFAYLKNLPVDFLKIDGLFVKDIIDDPIDLAMVRSINQIGHVMGKRTIAEFVESEEILERLREIGVDYAQGLAVGPPTALDRER